MIKASLVNMYLHNISEPKISEYDTLSDDSKWNEYFDLILANPPFFTPTGGIKPHNRFALSSKKAEILFTSYINEHLTPKGRAAIIVPEGILFRKASLRELYNPMKLRNLSNSLRFISHSQISK